VGQPPLTRVDVTDDPDQDMGSAQELLALARSEDVSLGVLTAVAARWHDC
jgi:hypothetical protein